MLKKVAHIARQLPGRIPSKAEKPKPGEYLVALDIGTENVKALVCRRLADGAEIIGVGRVHQGLTDMQAGAVADIAAVVENCDAALNEAEQQAGVSARSAVIGIAGELIKGATSTVSVRRTDPNKPLQIEELDRIIAICQDRAKKRATQQLMMELGGKEVDVRLVNSALVSVSIDGLSVTNPINFQGRVITLQLYTAYAPLVHIGALEKIAQQLDLELLAVAAEPFAVARSVMGNDPDKRTDAILIDIGGGTTDIALLHEGGVEGTKMFGIGGRVFTRGIERDLGVNYATAEKLKLALSSTTLPAKRPLIEASLRKTLKVWLDGVELALAEFDNLDHLPHQIYLCGGGASLEMLIKELEATSWYKELPFARKPTIQLIEPDEAIGMTDTTGILNDHTYITALGLARVGIDCLGQLDAEPVSFRERVNKVLSI